MRIAVVSDVHANLPALEAALCSIDRIGCDLLYSTGDVVAIGPHPAECLERLLNHPRACFVMGNHDALFAEGIPSVVPPGFSRSELAHHQWVSSVLDPSLRALVRSWPYLKLENIHGLRVAFTHYGRDATGKGFLPIVESSAENLDALFPGLEADLVFFGHDHNASDVIGEQRCYINPGSVGCHAEPVARFALLEVSRSGEYEVTRHAVGYDDSSLLRDMRTRKVPARDFLWRAFFGGRKPGFCPPPAA